MTNEAKRSKHFRITLAGAAMSVALAIVATGALAGAHPAQAACTSVPGCGSGPTASPSPSATTPTPTPTPDPTDTDTAPTSGSWVDYDSLTTTEAAAVPGIAGNGADSMASDDLGALASVNSASSSDDPDSIPVDPGGGCPGGTTYSGAHAPWSCMEIAADNAGKGHDVWFRVGKASTSTVSGFGYAHFYIDHNLDLDPALVIIYNNAHGIKQTNGRYLYGEAFRSPKGVLQYVEVYEQRTVGTGSPDKHPMGVVTAFCRNASYVEENKCPEWVNETL